ncbi:hypothetical protein [Metabacillus fastidiosus]|uniref:hypothetical protein n=1 Tax=Metabacillus fastidiosus TaxID=1458 RepID=UPI0008271FCF|nr:hypothetical protein [Metabacillus fastidiosus]MED4464747.1 hypothetical protein [Metabacillus fastidiosus]
MVNLTIEQVSRVLTDRFGMFFTSGGIKSLVEGQFLGRVAAEEDDRHYSSVGWRVCRQSVIQYLQSKGFAEQEINKVLSL